MFTNNIIVLLFITFMCIVIHKTYSFENGQQKTSDDIITEPHIIKSDPTFGDEYPRLDLEIPTYLSKRRSESAEKYFDWAGKTQRPVEFLRGKRFWLFAKQDEGGTSAELIPPVYTHQSSLTQGLWRSGIVGRRRRR